MLRVTRAKRPFTQLLSTSDQPSCIDHPLEFLPHQRPLFRSTPWFLILNLSRFIASKLHVIENPGGFFLHTRNHKLCWNIWSVSGSIFINYHRSSYTDFKVCNLFSQNIFSMLGDINTRLGARQQFDSTGVITFLFGLFIGLSCWFRRREVYDKIHRYCDSSSMT